MRRRRWEGTRRRGRREERKRRDGGVRGKFPQKWQLAKLDLIETPSSQTYAVGVRAAAKHTFSMAANAVLGC